MPRALRWSQGGGGLSYERGTPVFPFPIGNREKEKGRGKGKRRDQCKGGRDGVKPVLMSEAALSSCVPRSPFAVCFMASSLASTSYSFI